MWGVGRAMSSQGWGTRPPPPTTPCNRHHSAKAEADVAEIRPRQQKIIIIFKLKIKKTLFLHWGQ